MTKQLYDKKPKASNYKTKRANTHRCAYCIGEERCFNLGTMTSTTKPNDDTKWYCSGHMDSIEGRNAAYGEHVLYESRLTEPGPPKLDWREELMQERLAKEPYYKHPGETSKQYARRMFRIMKTMKMKTIPQDDWDVNKHGTGPLTGDY